MAGEVGILNVGAGDTKLTFDRNNPAESIRAGRIVEDMLRRGYALLVEVERNGVKAYERARGFNLETSEYIIADFDPLVAQAADRAETVETNEEAEPQTAPTADAPRPKQPRGGRTKTIHASDTRAVAVARSAGG